jgi:hypothetical protein
MRLNVTVRSVTKGEAIGTNISATTNNPNPLIGVWPLGLSSYGSVKPFAKRVKTLNRLDAFVQNAGI